MKVLIIARAPRRGEVLRSFEPILSPDRVQALAARLLLGSVAWARALAADEIWVAHEPVDAGPELVALLGDDVRAIPQRGDGIADRLRDAVGRVLADGAGPLLVVWPDLVDLVPDRGEQALADLDAGADIVLGGTYDGGVYLVGLARPLPDGLVVDEATLSGAGALPSVFAAALGGSGPPLEVGLLRVERALRGPDDLIAARADPLLAGPLSRLLRRPDPS